MLLFLKLILCMPDLFEPSFYFYGGPYLLLLIDIVGNHEDWGKIAGLTFET